MQGKHLHRRIPWAQQPLLSRILPSMPPKSKAAWATQVDDEEASGVQALAPLPAAFGAAEPEAAFPSLGDAAKVVETKADRKKKQQKMSLADFNRCGHEDAVWQLLSAGISSRLAFPAGAGDCGFVAHCKKQHIRLEP